MDAGLWEGKGRQERRIEGEDGGMDREVEVGGEREDEGHNGGTGQGEKGVGFRS